MGPFKVWTLVQTLRGSPHSGGLSCFVISLDITKQEYGKANNIEHYYISYIKDPFIAVDSK